MKKSTLVMILCLVLAVALGVGGTLAYLTDNDGDVNVMTVGYVTITQNEQERVEIGNPDAGLDEFTQKKAMNPAVIKDHKHKEIIDANGWKVEIRDQVKNYVDKIVSVTNTGANDAYVRTIFAFPEAGEFNTTYMANEQWLHWNGVSDEDHMDIGGNGWMWGRDRVEDWPGNTDNWHVYENVVINGKKYDIYIATNKNVLAPKETTAPSLLGMFIDERVDCNVNPTTGEKNYTFGDVNLGDISTLDVLVLSQAVQADGFENAWEAFDSAFPTTEENLVKWLSNIEQGTPGDKNDTNNPPEQFTGDPQKLATLLSEATDAQSGDVTIELTESYDMSGYDWTPISVDGYHGAGIVTVKGNGHTIKNLNAPLFAGGFAGKSGIVIEDLTIADSTMTAPTDQGSGAFICCADSMTIISLDNCHAKNVTLNGASRTGGLVGWTSGYSRQDDGPVKSYVTLTDCTVEGCTINAETESAGGLIGHSGASDWTFTTVTNCSVIDTEINGGNGKTGVYVGTANVGETTLTGCSYEDVTGNVNADHPEYGRFVPGTTGKLTIDGKEI